MLKTAESHPAGQSPWTQDRDQDGVRESTPVQRPGGESDSDRSRDQKLVADVYIGGASGMRHGW